MRTGVVVVTPEPPEVATGTVTHGWPGLGARDWAPVVTVADCAVLGCAAQAK